MPEAQFAHLVPSSLHCTLVTVPEVLQVKRADVLVVVAGGFDVIVTVGGAGGRATVSAEGTEAIAEVRCLRLVDVATACLVLTRLAAVWRGTQRTCRRVLVRRPWTRTQRVRVRCVTWRRDVRWVVAAARGAIEASAAAVAVISRATTATSRAIRSFRGTAFSFGSWAASGSNEAPGFATPPHGGCAFLGSASGARSFLRFWCASGARSISWSVLPKAHRPQTAGFAPRTGANGHLF
jgi:hypothetical protein